MWHTLINEALPNRSAERSLFWRLASEFAFFFRALEQARKRRCFTAALTGEGGGERARAGSLKLDDVSGGTFTITNLGMFEIDAFTPMVNLPQCAILGLGRIIAKPVVVDETSEQVAVRRMLSLSLTFDHRLVDGAPAARFLQRIKHLVERPTLWLFR